jgi:hypothetical protein
MSSLMALAKVTKVVLQALGYHGGGAYLADIIGVVQASIQVTRSPSTWGRRISEV